MTDWLPFAGVLGAGVCATLALTLRAMQSPHGREARLRQAWWALSATVAVTGLLYLVYLVWGDRWLWYEQELRPAPAFLAP